MIIDSFRKELAGFGLTIDEIVADGNIHRFKQSGDKGKPCWYVLRIVSNNLAYGNFGCFKRGLSESWCNRDYKSLAANERKNLTEKQNILKNEFQKRQIEAISAAQYIWENADQNLIAHSYLESKQVKSFGLRLYKNTLLIPLYDETDKLSSLQFILSTGEKWFKKNAKTKGCYFAIGKLAKTICIAEGYATGATIHEATDHAVVVAFNAYNLLPVAQVIRKKYPESEIVICADNDAFTSNGNTGVTKATEAAKAINAKLAIPQFKNISTKPTDFNDLLLLEGLEITKNQIANAKSCEESLEETIDRLSNLSPKEYKKISVDEAAKISLAVKHLNVLVDQARKEKETLANSIDDELQNGIEPWDEEASGFELAEEIKSLILAHIVLTEKQAIVITLWIMATYCFNAFNIFPKLLINSPMPRCGKSTLLQILICTVHRYISASNITPAAIFRSVECWQPTLLIDELDTYINNKDELRGIINSGHSKLTAFVLRVEGDNKSRMPKRFSTWSPMAIAMINNPPSTIIDRSIVIPLKRKLASEKTKKLKADCFDRHKNLRRKAKRWAEDNFDKIKAIDPIMPDCENDRATDNWYPLFAVAKLLGFNWFQDVTLAFQELNSIDREESNAIILLDNIRNIFESEKLTEIHSDKLVASLNTIAYEGVGGDFGVNNDKPLTKNGLARILKSFDIKSRQIWINGSNRNGYKLDDFTDTFDRYLVSSFQTPKTLEANTG